MVERNSMGNFSLINNYKNIRALLIKGNNVTASLHLPDINKIQNFQEYKC